ncbi:MAG: antitoxin [Clostridia bacterium]|nr:antitoxin [Clostridia bacterium]
MESTKSRGGRPAGRKKTAKIEVLIEPEVKEEFMRFIEIDGKTASVEIYSWIRQYINKRKVEEK